MSDSSKLTVPQLKEKLLAHDPKYKVTGKLKPDLLSDAVKFGLVPADVGGKSTAPSLKPEKADEKSDTPAAPDSAAPAKAEKAAKAPKAPKAKAADNGGLWVPVITEGVTVAIGTYPTEKAAIEALVTFIETHWPVKYKNTLELMDEDLKSKLAKMKTAEFVDELLSKKKVRDAFEKTLTFNLGQYVVGKTPDFRFSDDWDFENLYEFVNSVVNGDTKSFKEKIEDIVEGNDSEEIDEADLDESDEDLPEGIEESGDDEVESESESSENDEDDVIDAEPSSEASDDEDESENDEDNGEEDEE
jgi:hypothetical protein